MTVDSDSTRFYGSSNNKSRSSIGRGPFSFQVYEEEEEEEEALYIAEKLKTEIEIELGRCCCCYTVRLSLFATTKWRRAEEEKVGHLHFPSLTLPPLDLFGDDINGEREPVQSKCVCK